VTFGENVAQLFMSRNVVEGQIAGVTLLTEKVSTLADVTTVMLVHRVERLFDSGLVVSLEFH